MSESSWQTERPRSTSVGAGVVSGPAGYLRTSGEACTERTQNRKLVYKEIVDSMVASV